MAAADTDQPQEPADGLPVPGTAGPQTDEAATPAQRALQREMARAARSRLVQRVATLPAQDVQGQAGGGLHTPDLEAMAAADTDQPQTADGLPVPGTAGPQTDEAATPAQRGLQRAMAQAARSRLVQRVATWSASAPKETNNLAAAVMNGTAAGVTWPTLNGTIFWSNAAARGALVKPTVTTAAAGAGFEATVADRPHQPRQLRRDGALRRTVDDRRVPGPRSPRDSRRWRSAPRRATTTFRAIGDPSDAEMQAANRRHEDKHAADHKARVRCDHRAVGHQAHRGQGGRDEVRRAAPRPRPRPTCGRHMGGTPDEIADAFMAKCAAAVVAYHGSRRRRPDRRADGPDGRPATAPPRRRSTRTRHERPAMTAPVTATIEAIDGDDAPVVALRLTNSVRRARRAAQPGHRPAITGDALAVLDRDLPGVAADVVRVPDRLRRRRRRSAGREAAGRDVGDPDPEPSGRARTGGSLDVPIPLGPFFLRSPEARTGCPPSTATRS